jgi:hypothetical protein
MPGNPGVHLFGGNILQHDGGIVAATRQEVSIGTKHDGHNRIIMPGKPGVHLFGGNILQHDGGIVAATHQEVSIGTKRDSRDGIGMPGEQGTLVAGGDFPQVDPMRRTTTASNECPGSINGDSVDRGRTTDDEPLFCNS